VGGRVLDSSAGGAGFGVVLASLSSDVEAADVLSRI
jgi:hypothetical protein